MKIEKELEKLKDIFKNTKGKGLKLDEITKMLGWSPKFKKENREIIEKWVSDGELIKKANDILKTSEYKGYLNRQ